MRIGVDVGGTNTDAVIMDGETVLATSKHATSKNVTDGIVGAITAVLKESETEVQAIKAVMIGTTQFTNAFVERKHLLPVGIVRIALPSSRGIPPLTDWPVDMAACIGDACFLVEGGFKFDGSVADALDERAVAVAAKKIAARGIRTAAITGLFSPVNSDMELRAREIFNEETPDIAVTLSSDIGRMGILERENAAVMNASLSDLAKATVLAFASAFERLDIRAPFYISQNDGTLMSAEFVQRYPVSTFASGPTNSMRGAAYLSGLEDALVADIGGTTTDIGVLSHRFPRESALSVDIGGVRTNFRMPDILAIGLGGGSLVHNDAAKISIGPTSLGYSLTKKALCFGGMIMCATDLAVAAGYVDIDVRTRVLNVPPDVVRNGVTKIHEMLTDAVDRMRPSAELKPLVLVGGGSILIRDDIAGVSKTLIPEHASVANAIGASIAQISGETDRVFAYETTGREAALSEAKQEACDRALAAGADPETVSVIDVEEIPLAYMPGGAVRIRVKVAGALKEVRSKHL